MDSFCRDNNIRFFNPYLSKYYRKYPNLRKASPYLPPLLTPLVRELRLMRQIEFVDFAQGSAYKNAILEGSACCKGWEFRSPESLKKYHHLYQQLFDPNIDKQHLFGMYLKRNAKELIIGVHIRRGDYAAYMNGRYYYDDSTYIDKIQQLISCLNRECRIIVFTNDTALDTLLYRKHFKDILFSNNPQPEDHYLMSRCDYIIGAPSTFSMWASFMGNKPFYHIADKDDTITLEKFTICENL